MQYTRYNYFLQFYRLFFFLLSVLVTVIMTNFVLFSVLVTVLLTNFVLLSSYSVHASTIKSIIFFLHLQSK